MRYNFAVSEIVSTFVTLGKIGAGVVLEPNNTDKGCRILASLRASRFRL